MYACACECVSCVCACKCICMCMCKHVCVSMCVCMYMCGCVCACVSAGASERHLDQLAFELMIPVATLREYVDLVEKGKALMLHGPQGSGKTLLAKNLAECLKV